MQRQGVGHSPFGTGAAFSCAATYTRGAATGLQLLTFPLHPAVPLGGPQMQRRGFRHSAFGSGPPRPVPRHAPGAASPTFNPKRSLGLSVGRRPCRSVGLSLLPASWLRRLRRALGGTPDATPGRPPIYLGHGPKALRPIASPLWADFYIFFPPRRNRRRRSGGASEPSGFHAYISRCR